MERRRFSLCGSKTLYDLCEMLFASRAHWSLKVLLHPVVRIVTVRPAPFSGVAFPMKIRRLQIAIKNPARRSSLACGELALPFRVARVSRLIGNFHTTGNSCGWQATPGSSRLPAVAATLARSKEAPNARNATPNRVAFHISALSLASQIYVDGLSFCRTLLQASPAGLPLLRSASLADALAGCLLFFGLVRTLPAPVHHWHLSSSNPGSILKFI